ncbi:MAG: HigA family addiction module antitoxin [Desulfovibrionaceae bacterium]|nr:HigA family addiction module antitoxin [Desulfovibrionaceae bacterium]
MIAIHPGEILREEYMNVLGLSAHALALSLGVPATRIHDIIHERRGISTDTALRLAKYFNTDMELWMNLQAQYEACKLKEEHALEFERIIPYSEPEHSVTV